MQHTLVIFSAIWSDSCYYAFPLWSRMAHRYSTARLSFVEVDVQHFEGLAREHKVPTNTGSTHLPVVILFEDGREVQRFPCLDEKTKEHMTVVAYKEKELVKYFDLDKRSMATKDIGVERKKAAT